MGKPPFLGGDVFLYFFPPWRPLVLVDFDVDVEGRTSNLEFVSEQGNPGKRVPGVYGRFEESFRLQPFK